MLIAGLVCAWLWTLNADVRTAQRIAEIARESEVEANRLARIATESEAKAKSSEKLAKDSAAKALLGYADRAFQERRYQTAAILAVESLDIQESAAGTAKLRSARANMLASLVWTSPSFHTITAVASGPQGKLMAAATGNDNVIRLWDIESRRAATRLEGHNGPVLSLAFHPSGNHVVSGSQDQTIRMWDLQTERLKWESVDWGSRILGGG